jgi:hypothetical protein
MSLTKQMQSWLHAKIGGIDAEVQLKCTAGYIKLSATADKAVFDLSKPIR